MLHRLCFFLSSCLVSVSGPGGWWPRHRCMCDPRTEQGEEGGKGNARNRKKERDGHTLTPYEARAVESVGSVRRQRCFPAEYSVYSFLSTPLSQYDLRANDVSQVRYHDAAFVDGMNRTTTGQSLRTNGCGTSIMHSKHPIFPFHLHLYVLTAPSGVHRPHAMSSKTQITLYSMLSCALISIMAFEFPCRRPRSLCNPK